MKREMVFDASDFEKKFLHFAKREYPDLVLKGERHAGEEIKLDADNVPPRTPHLEGMLRGSGKVIVEKNAWGKDKIEILIVYDMPYTTRWHEAEATAVNWSEPGVGPKYLESKLSRFRIKYIMIIVEDIKRGMR